MASISFIGPLSGYTEARVNQYRPLIQHDPANGVMKVTVDIAKLLAAFKASNNGTGWTAADKIALAPFKRGLNLLSGKALIHKLGSTATAKTAGQVFVLGDTTPTTFNSAGLKMQASGGTVGTVGTPVALSNVPLSYDAADNALVMSFLAVDAANELPVDGIFEVVFPITNTLPELNATQVNGAIV